MLLSLTRQPLKYPRIYGNVEPKDLICDSDLTERPEVTREARNHFPKSKKKEKNFQMHIQIFVNEIYNTWNGFQDTTHWLGEWEDV